MEISGQGSATQSTVRQIGSALGTAFAGATLSIALAATLPAAGFADATRWALLIAAVFLVLGFIGALRLRRASGHR